MSNMDERCVAVLREVIRHFGSQRRLAKHCGVSPQTIGQWLFIAKRIPMQHVPAISKETGIPPAALRPDYASILR